MNRFNLAASVYFAVVTLGLTAHAADEQKQNSAYAPKNSLYCSAVLAGTLDLHTWETIQGMNELRHMSDTSRAQLIAQLNQLGIKESSLRNPAKRKDIMVQLGHAAARVKKLDSLMDTIENDAKSRVTKSFPWSKPESAAQKVSTKKLTWHGFVDTEYVKYLKEKRELLRFLRWMETPDDKIGKLAFPIRTKEQQVESLQKLLFQSKWADDLLAESKKPIAVATRPTSGQLIKNAQKVLVTQPFEDFMALVLRKPNAGLSEIGRLLGSCGKVAANGWMFLEVKEYWDQISAITNPQPQKLAAPVDMRPATTTAQSKPTATTQKSAARQQEAAQPQPVAKKPLLDAIQEIKVVESVEISQSATPEHGAPLTPTSISQDFDIDPSQDTPQ